MPANTFPHVVEVSDVTALAAVHIAELDFGTRAFVEAESVPNFYLVQSALPNGADVIQSVPQALVGKPGAKWLRSTVVSPGGSTIPPPDYVEGIAGLQSTSSPTPVELGALELDPSLFVVTGTTRTIRFEAVLQCALGDSAQTATLELFNKTDAVSVTSLSTSSNNATFLFSATLAVPADLPNSSKLYVLRLSRAGADDLVICKLGRLRVLYT